MMPRFRLVPPSLAVLASLAAGLGAVAAGEAPSPRQIAVDVRVFSTTGRSPQPLREMQLTVQLTDAAPPDRPLRELDPYGSIFRVEYTWNRQGRDHVLWYFVDPRGGGRYQIDFAGQAIHSYTADSNEAALEAALKWLQTEVAAQYSQLARRLEREAAR